MTEKAKCTLCGEPMPPGEEMFKYHGYSGPCPKPAKQKIKSGIEMIADERREQIEKHGFDAAHDDRAFNGSGELSRVAAYLIANTDWHRGKIVATYPPGWRREFVSKFESKSEIEKLVIAGALIAAEIDRLQRIENCQA